MNARAEAAFSALVGLDPLRRAPEAAPGAPAAPSADASGAPALTDASIARIIATPRPGAAAAAPARRASPRATTPHRRRSRYGAIGLVASAAVAAITTVVWASPSAGSPPDQAANVPAQVAQAHSPART